MGNPVIKRVRVKGQPAYVKYINGIHCVYVTPKVARLLNHKHRGKSFRIKVSHRNRWESVISMSDVLPDYNDVPWSNKKGFAIVFRGNQKVVAHKGELYTLIDEKTAVTFKNLAIWQPAQVPP